MKFGEGNFGRWVVNGNQKTMECVGVLPANADPRPVFIALLKKGLTSTTRIEELKPRTHESYIFAGPVGPRGGKRKLYWPRVSLIEKVKTF